MLPGACRAPGGGLATGAGDVRLLVTLSQRSYGNRSCTGLGLRVGGEPAGSKCRRLGLVLCSEEAEVQQSLLEGGEKQALCRDRGGTQHTGEGKFVLGSVQISHTPPVPLCMSHLGS